MVIPNENAFSQSESEDVYIRLRITDNETGNVRIFETHRRDIFVGNSVGCDVILEGKDILPFHCRVQSISNHLFLESLETKEQIRIDSNPFQVGQYTLCRTSEKAISETEDSQIAAREENLTIKTEEKSVEEWQHSSSGGTSLPSNDEDINKLDFTFPSPPENYNPRLIGKWFVRENAILNLLEFRQSQSFFCKTNHWGYIVEGKALINFGDKSLVFESGDGIFIPAGTEIFINLNLLNRPMVIFVVDEIQASDKD